MMSDEERIAQRAERKATRRSYVAHPPTLVNVNFTKSSTLTMLPKGTLKKLMAYVEYSDTLSEKELKGAYDLSITERVNQNIRTTTVKVSRGTNEITVDHKYDDPVVISLAAEQPYIASVTATLVYALANDELAITEVTDA